MATGIKRLNRLGQILFNRALGGVMLAAVLLLVIFGLAKGACGHHQLMGGMVGKLLSKILPAAMTDQGIKLSGEFSSADGVKVGTPVQLAGVNIGQVCRIEFLPEKNRAKMELWIRSGIALAEDSEAVVVSYGFGAPKIVSLRAGGGMIDLANGGELFYTSGTVAIEKILMLVLERAEEKIPKP